MEVHMDRQMAMQMAADMGMDWAALEAEAETTGTPAMCAVCMEAAMRAEDAGTTPPPVCAGGCMLDGGAGPDGPAPETPERMAVAGLVAAWDAMVDEGETTEAEMAMGLADQLGQATQGWSAGMETDMEAHPELAALVGLAEDMDDEEWDTAWERWEAVEQEAARQWLAAHPEAEAEARAQLG